MIVMKNHFFIHNFPFLWLNGYMKTGLKVKLMGMLCLGLLALPLHGDDVKFTLEVQPKMNDMGQMVPATDDDVQETCRIIAKRLAASGTQACGITPEGRLIHVHVPQMDGGKLESLERLLTMPAKLEMLTVYPEQERVLADAEVQAAIAEYEQRLAQYNGLGVAERQLTPPPARPKMPEKLGLKDWQIVPGAPGEGYYVLQKPYAAMQKDVYVTGAEVAKAWADVVNTGWVQVELTRTGAERISRLTGSMQIGRDRLAVVLDGRVKADFVVQGPLSESFGITGLDAEGEAEALAKALTAQLSSEVKVVLRVRVSTEPQQEDRK